MEAAIYAPNHKMTEPWRFILLGPETRGLPQALLDELGQERVLRLPMQPVSRSLNMANSTKPAFCWQGTVPKIL